MGALAKGIDRHGLSPKVPDCTNLRLSEQLIAPRMDAPDDHDRFPGLQHR
jgi:hypothetical protein